MLCPPSLPYHSPRDRFCLLLIVLHVLTFVRLVIASGSVGDLVAELSFSFYTRILSLFEQLVGLL